MTESVRLRVEFKDRRILTKSQRTEGLRRSWILLQPHHRTISDLAAHLLHVFRLNHSCPDGLLISMDDFVLPPFESTGIFKDKDVVSIQRKGDAFLSEIDMIEDGRKIIEVEEIAERQAVDTGVKLLANEEFDKGKGGYESDEEEDEPDRVKDRDTNSKKRKRLDKPESSKRKKSKSAAGESSGAPEDVRTEVPVDKKKSSRKRNAKRSLPEKDKSIIGEGNDSSSSETDEKNNIMSEEATPSAKRSCQLQENGINGDVSSDKPDQSTKLPSRSARRKKAKRKWLRENMKAQKEELQQVQPGKPDKQQSSYKANEKVCNKADQQSSDKIKQKSFDKVDRPSSEKANKQLPDGENKESSHEQPNIDSDEEDNIVPVLTRPGHIRFAPIGKDYADQTFQQNETPVDTFQWNGITSKKKGQKWGMEKSSYSRKREYEDLYQEPSEILDTEQEIPQNNPLHFDKLALPTTAPKDGDQIAYRLLELSSCWTPEVSSYRVGRVAHYNPQSNKIVLVQVPEYPIVFEETFEETEEVSEAQPSLYKEDGSLETDYSSLIDVRIVKYGVLNTDKVVAGGQNGASALRPMNGTETGVALGFKFKNHKESQAAVPGFRLKNDKGTQTAASGFRLKTDNESQAAESGFRLMNIEKETPTTQENGKVSAWDEISQALNAKKAALSQENGWGKDDDGSERSSWSSRPWRGSALGPTMALLRAQSEL